MSENRYQQLVQHSPDAILVECGGEVVLANLAALRLYRANSENDLFGRTLISLAVPACRGDVTTAVEQALGGQATHATEERALGIDGSITDIEATRLAIRHDGKPAVYMIARDITTRKRLETQLRHQAVHDVLTGLPNRSYLSDCLHTALAQARQSRCNVAIAFIDLDRFKQINDAFGHHAGDTLLKRVADRLIGALRKSDVVVRVGGDEFVLLLRDCGDQTELAEVLDRLRNLISTSVTLEKQDVAVTCSIGCCTYPVDADDANDLLQLADAAMYRAKKSGGNGVRFHQPDAAQPSLPVHNAA